MDDFARLVERIPSYAGYGAEAGRYRTDQQVRAWVGERLAAADARLGLSAGPIAAHLERVLRACAFGDQALIKGLERRAFNREDLAALYALDREIVDEAATAEGLGLEAFEPLLDRIEALFAQRTALIEAQAETV